VLDEKDALKEVTLLVGASAYKPTDAERKSIVLAMGRDAMVGMKRFLSSVAVIAGVAATFSSRLPKIMGLLAPCSLAYSMTLPRDGVVGMTVLLEYTDQTPSLLAEYTKSRLELTRAGARHSLLKRFPPNRTAFEEEQLYTLEYRAISQLEGHEKANQFRHEVHLEALANVPLRSASPSANVSQNLMQALMDQDGDRSHLIGPGSPVNRPDIAAESLHREHLPEEDAEESEYASGARYERLHSRDRERTRSTTSYEWDKQSRNNSAPAPVPATASASSSLSEHARPRMSWADDDDGAELGDHQEAHQRDPYLPSSESSSSSSSSSLSSSARRSRHAVQLDGQGWPIKELPQSAASRGATRPAADVPRAGGSWTGSQFDDSDVDEDPYA